MRLFSRRAQGRRPAMPDHGEGPDHQDMALELIDAFVERDTTALAALTPADRAQQLAARELLYEYVDRLRDQAKASGLDPATRPECNAVAGPRDLTNALVDQAAEAQATAGDEDPS